MIIEHRKIGRAQEERAEALARKLAKLEREAVATLVPKHQHPYDAERGALAPLAFAEYVLKAEKMLFVHHGHDWVHDKYAPPHLKIQYASEVLVKLGLKPIDLGKKR